MSAYKKQPTQLHVENDSTLLEFLLQKMGGMTRTSIKQILSQRRVHVNRAIQTRHDFALQAGDHITIDSGKGNSQLIHPRLRIVYEDDYLLVVEKLPGLATVTAIPGSRETTVFSLLKAYVRRQNKRNSVFVVHRLDRETSGLLVFAKSQELQTYMREWWNDLVKQRTYVAVVEGEIEKKEDTIISYLTKDNYTKMVYSSPTEDGGKKAITHYKVLKTNIKEDRTPETLSLVELHLETGRTNQIRVHMASIGHPVLGDRKYGHGEQYSPTDRLCLHAQTLEFIHPVGEQRICFTTALPKEFRIV